MHLSRVLLSVRWIFLLTVPSEFNGESKIDRNRDGSLHDYCLSKYLAESPQNKCMLTRLLLRGLVSMIEILSNSVELSNTANYK